MTTRQNFFGNLFVLSTLHISFWVILIRMNLIGVNESGFLENLEALLMLLAPIIFLMKAFHKKETVSCIFNIGLSWLFFNFFLREIDLRDCPFNIHPIIMRLRHGKEFYIWVGFLWFIFTIFLLKNFRPLLEHLKRWIVTPAGQTILLANIILLFTLPLDSRLFPLPKMTLRMTEEVLEINSFLLILLASWWDFKQVSWKDY